MLIQNTIFYSQEWRWAKFIKFLISRLDKYHCVELKIPPDFSYKESSYGPKKSKKNINSEAIQEVLNREVFQKI